MKARFLTLTTREKYAIVVILSIVAFTYLYDNVIFDVYNLLVFSEHYTIDNLYKQNWGNSLAVNTWALSGLSIALGITMFPKIILGTTTTPMFPGMIFFVASMLSIPLMIKLTSGITKWKRILYIYLVATQLSSLLLIQWSNFGA